jgi:hypothetical protein
MPHHAFGRLGCDCRGTLGVRGCNSKAISKRRPDAGDGVGPTRNHPPIEADATMTEFDIALIMFGIADLLFGQKRYFQALILAAVGMIHLVSGIWKFSQKPT